MTSDSDTISDALREIAMEMMPSWYGDMDEHGDNAEMFDKIIIDIWNKHNPDLKLQSLYQEEVFEVKKVSE